ncbi:MAG: hypothetical protein [Bacteriophage sp.]|nr:MAG: hypothetical protein [Bacteriophage sp.]
MAINNRVIAGVFSAALLMAVPLVEKVEDVKHKVYIDIAGVPTVCAGITGKDVIMGKTYSTSECSALLAKHIKIASDYVDSRVKVKMPDTMKAAVYSFTFNVGRSAFGSSTMLKLINQGRYIDACNQLHRWVYAKDPKTGKRVKVKGLVNRRNFEYEYCVKDLK